MSAADYLIKKDFLGHRTDPNTPKRSRWIILVAYANRSVVHTLREVQLKGYLKSYELLDHAELYQRSGLSQL